MLETLFIILLPIAWIAAGVSFKDIEPETFEMFVAMYKG